MNLVSHLIRMPIWSLLLHKTRFYNLNWLLDIFLNYDSVFVNVHLILKMAHHFLREWWVLVLLVIHVHSMLNRWLLNFIEILEALRLRVVRDLTKVLLYVLLLVWLLAMVVKCGLVERSSAWYLDVSVNLRWNIGLLRYTFRLPWLTEDQCLKPK